MPALEEVRRELPQFTIQRLLGRGGMGAVYQGCQENLARGVAIKILPPGIDRDDLQFADRFKQEAKAMAMFKHPGIVTVYEAGETPGGLLYLVMELISGEDVGDLLGAQGKLPPAEAIRIAARVCEAISYAHQRGVIHRDIKPSNVMIESDGTVKVADFGLAKLTLQDSGFTRSDLALGSPDFAAPECSQPGVVPDARADIFSLGVMLYQMLAGKLPRGRFDPPSRIVEALDPRLDAIIDKALQTDRDKRYSSAAEMSADLARVSFRPASRGKWRYPVLVVAVAGVAAAALLAWPKSATAPRSLPTEKKGSSVSPSPWLSAMPNAALLQDAGDGWVLRTGNQNSDPNYNAVFGKDMRGRWLCNGGVRADRRIPPGQFREVLLSVRHNGQARQFELVLSVPEHGSPDCLLEIREYSLASTTSGGKREHVTLAGKRFPISGNVVSVEFLAVAKTMFARLNGHVLTCELESEVSAGLLMLRGAGKIPFRDFQYLNLDGLPEAEAYQLAGIDVPQVPAGLPSKQDLLRKAKTFGGHTYAWVTRSCSWFEAEAVTRQAGGCLVFVNSPAEQQWLLNHPGKWFIGGRRPAHAADPTAKGGFAWFSGEPITFDGWMPGEPGRATDEADRPFMCLSSGQNPSGWCDAPARDDSVEGFIIEWDSENTTTLDRAPLPAPAR